MVPPHITMTGNLVADPELRFTGSGAAVAKFHVAATERCRDRQTHEWVDGDKCFIDVEVWRQLAENVAESAVRGTTVTVTGRRRQRSYEKDGQTRFVFEIKADDVSISLSHQTARATRNRSQNGGGAPAAPAAPAAAAPVAGGGSGDWF